MLGMLVVSHGRFAEDLVEAARTIVGDVEALEAVSIDWNDDPEAARGRIREAVARVDRGAGVLLLTDMFGGTPTNLALSLPDSVPVEVVTGVNLPMVVAFASRHDERDLGEVAAGVAARGREAIQVASALLEPREEPPEARR